MAAAICTNGHVTHWRATRGAAMPATCETCGEPNTKARIRVEHDDDGRIVRSWYERVPAPPKRETITCPVCGRKRRAPSPAVRQFDKATVVASNYGDWFDSVIEVSAGTWVCWHHRPLPQEANYDTPAAA